MKREQLDIVVFGLSITSSWGNGHATTYRALLRELAARGHRITFFEKDVEWYRENRDLNGADYCDIYLYNSLDELTRRHASLVSRADVAVIGSYVPDGIQVARWMLTHATGLAVFYDIDTPITVADVKTGRCEYLDANLIPQFDLYLSFTGGPILREIEQTLGARCARLLACSVDPSLYYPDLQTKKRWHLGYLGTYSTDRQPKLGALLIEPALKHPEMSFAVAGSLYPDDLVWAPNIDRIDHLPPSEHREFYNSQCFTLNVTRRNMVAAGYSPSVRLFEAAACGTPIITDPWAGLNMFFEPGREILVAENTEQCAKILCDWRREDRSMLAQRARKRVLSEHSAAERARQFEGYLAAIRECSDEPALVQGK